MPSGLLPAFAAGVVSFLALALRLGRRAPADGIPLLDVAALADANQLRRAATDLGILRLSGHGISSDVVMNASREFFARPEGVKRSARSGSGAVGGFQRGYIPLGGESGLREFVELKEGFCYGRAGGVREEHVSNGTDQSAGQLQSCEQLVSPNAWPEEDGDADEEGGWRRTLEAYIDECLGLTDTLHTALSTAMGRPPDFLGRLARGGEDISLMRLFHYFSPDAFPHIAPGVPRTGSSPHTDWHLVTIVLQDETGGLQVRRPRPPFDWIDVPPVKDELIVILGDYMSVLSEGRFVSPVHRVLLPANPHERFSLTFFRYPRCGATVPADAARRAEKRARRRTREQQRHPEGGGAYNTLVAADPKGEGLNAVARRAWGDLLVDKWNGVASNKA